MKLKKILNTWKINWYNQEHNFSNLHLRNKIFTPKNLHLRIKETVYIYIYIYIYCFFDSGKIVENTNFNSKKCA